MDNDASAFREWKKSNPTKHLSDFLIEEVFKDDKRSTTVIRLTSKTKKE